MIIRQLYESVAMAEASNLCDTHKRFVPQTRHDVLTDRNLIHVYGLMGHQNKFDMADRDIMNKK